MNNIVLVWCGCGEFGSARAAADQLEYQFNN